MRLKIGLIDVDGHHFPNLPLMKISAYHKQRGDHVEWYQPLFSGHMDIVYMSKVFSFTPDYEYPIDAEIINRGGTGYCIKLVDGKEVFDESQNVNLPKEIESMFPDYSIYPQYDFAVTMTSRGCPRGCDFCHVVKKEGRCSVKVADVENFWNGQKSIEVCDPNITACKDKRDLFKQYRETNAIVTFNQGLDIRLINDEDIDDLNNMKVGTLHFAWDNPKDDLEDKFKNFSDKYKRKGSHGQKGMVYCLTNFNSTMEENLYRIYTLRDLGFDPYVMIYNKPNAPKEIRHLQRWCNNKFVFRSCNKFEDYKG